MWKVEICCLLLISLLTNASHYTVSQFISRWIKEINISNIKQMNIFLLVLRDVSVWNPTPTHSLTLLDTSTNNVYGCNDNHIFLCMLGDVFYGFGLKPCVSSPAAWAQISHYLVQSLIACVKKIQSCLPKSTCYSLSPSSGC